MFYSFSYPKTLIKFGLLISLLMFGASAVAGAEDRQLRSIKSMIVVPDSPGVTIYVSDPVSGAIFFLKRETESPGLLSFSDFKLLTRTAPDYPNPSGLAYSRGKLIVCDKQANAVFTVDLSGEENRIERVPLQGLVEHPEYIAVSETDTWAIASDNRVQYFSSEAKEPVTLMTGVGDIDRIAFDGNTLLVLDEKGAGDLYSFTLGYKEVVEKTPTRLFSEIRGQLPHIQDFALYRGVYYIAGHLDVSTFPRSTTTSQPEAPILKVPLPAGDLRNIDKIFPSANSLYILDSKQAAILAAPRAVPIVVDFPKADSGSVADQAGILDLMENKGALLKRNIVSEKLYDNINDFVRAELLAGLQNSQGQPENEAVVAMGRLICRLNKWRCTEEKEKGGIVLTRESGSIGVRNQVTVPISEVRGYKVLKAAGERRELDTYLTELKIMWDPLESTCRHASLSIL